MRLAALVESVEHVCCRYRLRAFQRLLDGHSLDLHALPRNWWNRLRIGGALAGSDAVVLQRKLLSQLESSLLRKRARKLIFDFDDAVWLRDSYSPKGHHDSRRLRRFKTIVAQCDVIVAGNAFLAENAARWAKHTPIRIIPTCVDVGRYSLAQHDQPAGQATLVWIGSSSTLRGLEAIRPFFEKMGADNPRLELKLVCDGFPSLRNMRVVFRPWSESGEATELTSSDIGISWTPDDPWSRGKCGLKVLQYMAAGLPVVANPVGVQSEMIQHGTTGFLASTEAEWLNAIRILAHDVPMRREMGQTARRAVETLYGTNTGAASWKSLLAQLSNERISA